MREIVAHVVAAEGQHRHRVKAQFAECATGRRRRFARHDRAEKHAVIPVERLGHERHGRAATTTEENRGNRHTLGVLPLGCNCGALRGRRGEACVRVCSWRVGLWSPRVVAPIGGACGWLITHAFPPHVAVRGECSVGEEAVGVQRGHRVGVRLPPGVGGDAEEAGLRVDGVEPTIVAELHPADVVANGFDLPAFDGRHEHRQVGLAACRGKRPGDVLHFARRAGELHDQHVLGEPAVVASHHRRDA